MIKDIQRNVGVLFLSSQIHQRKGTLTDICHLMYYYRIESDTHTQKDFQM